MQFELDDYKEIDSKDRKNLDKLRNQNNRNDKKKERKKNKIDKSNKELNVNVFNFVCVKTELKVKKKKLVLNFDCIKIC